MRIVQKLVLKFNIKKVLCIGLTVAAGCIENYSPPIIATDHRYLIVDGFLVSKDSSFVKLTRSQLIYDNEPAQRESEATVTIENEDGYTCTLYEKTKGLYVAQTLNLDPQFQYRLHIRTSDASDYLSEFVPLLKSPELDSIVFEEATDDEINFQIYSHDPENKSHNAIATRLGTLKLCISTVL